MELDKDLTNLFGFKWFYTALTAFDINIHIGFIASGFSRVFTNDNIWSRKLNVSSNNTNTIEAVNETCNIEIDKSYQEIRENTLIHSGRMYVWREWFMLFVANGFYRVILEVYVRTIISVTYRKNSRLQ